MSSTWTLDWIRGWRRPWRLRTWLLVGLAALLGIVLGGHRAFLRLTAIHPPVEAGVGVARPPVIVRGARSFVGPSWLSRERGLWEYHLTGDPFLLGYANARLGSPLLIETEEYLFSEMRRYIPSVLAMQLVKVGVLLRYRTLPQHIPLEQRIELAGLAEGQSDLHGDFLPTYHRVLFYHALHDITQGLEHSPMLGCTAVAASRSATTSGHLLIGRNFDFEGPELFDREKAVLFFKPQGRLAFASVAWSGMMGVVTGLNQAGVYASVNALRSDDKSDAGVPVELLLREVLERAHNLDEALALLRSHPVLVPDLYLLGDGKTGDAVVVERSPSRFVVRRMAGAGQPGADTLTVANHALSSEFVGDRESTRLRDELTSGARFARAEELVQRQRGALDPAAVLSILRDKRGPGDRELGLGNRNALDALIATHSVVVDATDRVLWVGIGPHALGRYVAFDLKRELLDQNEGPAPVDLPEDPVLHSDDYRAFLQMQRALRAAETLRDRQKLDPAIETARWAVALGPRSADAHLLLADLLARRGREAARTEDRAEAKRLYTEFLTLSPPYRRDAERARAYLSGS